MKFLTLLLFVNCLCSPIWAQSPPDLISSTNYGGTASDNAYSGSENIICGSSSSINGDVGGNNGGLDFWIVKKDESQNILWDANFGGSQNDAARSHVVLEDGSIVILGYTQSANGDVSQNNGGNDYWLIKIDSDGNLLWEKSFGGSGNDYGIFVSAMPDGGFVTCGNSVSSDGDVSDNAGGRDVWVTRHNSDGDLLWEAAYGGSQDDAAQEIKWINGALYFTANTQSSDGDVSGHHGGRDSWTVKLDESGNILWQICVGGSNDDLSSGIIPSNTGDGIVLVGQAASSDGDISENEGEYDLLVYELSADGELIWVSTFGGSQDEFGSTGINAGNDSGYILCGNTLSDDGDVGGNNGDRDGWLVRVDNQGVLQWEQNFGGSGVDRIYQVLQVPTGYQLTGQSNSNDGDITNANGDYDFWIVQLGGDPLGLTDEEISEFNVFPNPTNGDLNLSWSSNLRPKSIMIRDNSGRTVVNQNISELTKAYELNNLQSGVYYVTILGVENTITRKIIVQ